MAIFGISDGLGNQLFQYAAAVNYHRRSGGVPVFWTGLYGRPGARQDRPLLLRTLFEQIETCENPVDDLSMRVLMRLRGRYGRLSVPRIAYANKNAFDDAEIMRAEFRYVLGYFQSERYFYESRREICDSIREALERRSSFTHEPMPDTVAVHVRRGDYLNLSNMLIDVSRIRTVVEKFDGRNRFIVFSDDKEFAKKLDLGVKFTVSEIEDPLSEMHYMSMCHHYIIANSTYSWWASYISCFDDKKIYLPENWFGNGDADEFSHERALRY